MRIVVIWLLCQLLQKCRFGQCLTGHWLATPIQMLSFIHSVFCLTTGPKPPTKWFLHIVRSRASSFKWEYPLLSLRSSSSFLCLLPRLLVTSISLFTFPWITCFRRQFLRKMWPIQLAFHFLISCRIFLCSLTLSNTSSLLTWSVQFIFSIHLQHHISKLSMYFWSAAWSIQVSAPYKAMLQMWHFTSFFLKFKSNLLVKRVFFLLNVVSKDENKQTTITIEM